MTKLCKSSKNIIFGAFAVLVFCVSVFLCFNNLGKDLNSACAVKITEDSLKNKIDLLETNENTLSSMFGSSKLSSAPFNSSAEQFLSGKSVLLDATDKYNQTNQLLPFSNNSSKLSSGQSVFLWLFIPDDPLIYFYDLTITLHFSSSQTISWKFDYQELNKMCDNFKGSSMVNYGWKLFELNPNSSITPPPTLPNENLSSVQVAYQYGGSEIDQIINIPSSTISVYHVMLADTINQASGIIGYSNYVAYKVSQDFTKSLNGIYTTDSKVLCKSSADIFEYLFVGRQNLLSSATSGFYWQLSINANGVKEEYDFGKSYKFYTSGEYSIGIKLKEQHLSSSYTVLTFQNSFYVNDFKLGYFALPNYTAEAGSTKLIVFNYSNGLILDSDITVKCSDNSVAKITYYKKDNKIEVEVTGLKKGTVNITIEATGHREGKNSEFYSSSVQIRVVSDDTGTFTKIVLWGSLGVFGAILLTIIVISVVKARQNSVK